MPQLFISHVEEDETVAVNVAHALEAIGYTTWYYERDSEPGTPYQPVVKVATAASVPL